MRLKVGLVQSIALGIPLILASFLTACGDRASNGTSQASPAATPGSNANSTAIGAKSSNREERSPVKTPATEYRCPKNSYIENTYETENFLIAICFEPVEEGIGRQLYVGTDKSDRSNQIVLDSAAGRDGVLRAVNGNVTYAINEQELVVTEGDKVILQESVIATSYKPHYRPESATKPIPPDEPEVLTSASSEDTDCPGGTNLDSYYETENFFISLCIEPADEGAGRLLYVGSEKSNPSNQIILDAAGGRDGVIRAQNDAIVYEISDTHLSVLENDSVILSEPVIASSGFHQ
jgi:hypothetical protein